MNQQIGIEIDYSPKTVRMDQVGIVVKQQLTEKTADVTVKLLQGVPTYSEGYPPQSQIDKMLADGRVRKVARQFQVNSKQTAEEIQSAFDNAGTWLDVCKACKQVVPQ